jgi:hypothetical protein
LGDRQRDAGAGREESWRKAGATCCSCCRREGAASAMERRGGGEMAIRRKVEWRRGMFSLAVVLDMFNLRKRRSGLRLQLQSS